MMHCERLDAALLELHKELMRLPCLMLLVYPAKALSATQTRIARRSSAPLSIGQTVEANVMVDDENDWYRLPGLQKWRGLKESLGGPPILDTLCIVGGSVDALPRREGTPRPCLHMR